MGSHLFDLRWRRVIVPYWNQELCVCMRAFGGDLCPSFIAHQGEQNRSSVHERFFSLEGGAEYPIKCSASNRRHRPEEEVVSLRQAEALR